MRHVLMIGILLASGCAVPLRQAASQPADQDCFNMAMVQGVSMEGAATARLTLASGAQYDVNLSGPGCGEMQWSQPVPLGTTASSWLCPDRAMGLGDIRFLDQVTQQGRTCHIEAVHVVSAASG